MASNEEADSDPAVLYKKPSKILTTTVSVAEPSPQEVYRSGSLVVGGPARASTTNFHKCLLAKDIWRKAKLYLAETTICFNIENIGECILTHLHSFFPSINSRV